MDYKVSEGAQLVGEIDDFAVYVIKTKTRKSFQIRQRTTLSPNEKFRQQTASTTPFGADIMYEKKASE